MQSQDDFEDYADAQSDDTITAVEYCTTGEYLATGDRTGRITVLRVDSRRKKGGGGGGGGAAAAAPTDASAGSDGASTDPAGGESRDNWLPYFQFQSHEPEFDFLKSLEIEAKINQIKFCRPICGNTFLLSTNDKTIKLWKIGHRKQFVRSAAAAAAAQFSESGRLELPQRRRRRAALQRSGRSLSAETRDTPAAAAVAAVGGGRSQRECECEGEGEAGAEPTEGEVLHAHTKRVFANAHTYHINSLAMNSDGETFLSADDLRINWWNLDHNDTSFNIIDIKPENMEELTEVITAVQFHPSHCHTLIYSSSRGAIKMCDTRSSALCHTYAKTFIEQNGGGAAGSSNTSKSFIADILNSISDVNFSQDGRFLVARDYLSVKIWDVNMESKPVKTIPLHDYLRPMLFDLYTSDIIFDKFEVACSANGKSIATGSYSNQLKVFHQDSKSLKQITLPSIEDSDLCPKGSVGLGISPTSVYEISGIVDITKSLDKTKISQDPNPKNGTNSRTTAIAAATTMSAADIRLEEKVLHCTWHPENNTIAVAGKAGLCLYKI